MTARRRRLLLLVGGLAIVALTVLAVSRLERRPVAVEGLEPPSTLAVNIVNFGHPPGPTGVLTTSGDPLDHVLTVHWKDEATLERVLLQILGEAERRRLDGTWRDGTRRAAVDLIFASTHSARIPVPGEEGELVGQIVVDRSQPSPARAGLQAVLRRLGASHTGRFPHVLVHSVFLLSCASDDDTDDHALVHETVTRLTTRRPAHILTTSARVSPDYRHISAGFASGAPFVIHDSRPDPDGRPRQVPFLYVGAGGYLDLASGYGMALGRPPN
jgi:hypothetical protein